MSLIVLIFVFLQGDAGAAQLCVRCFQLILASRSSDTELQLFLSDTYSKQAAIGCSFTNCKSKWCCRGGLPAMLLPAASAWAAALLAQGCAKAPAEFYVCVPTNARLFTSSEAAMVPPVPLLGAPPPMTAMPSSAATAAKGKRKSGKDSVAAAFF